MEVRKYQSNVDRFKSSAVMVESFDNKHLEFKISISSFGSSYEKYDGIEAAESRAAVFFLSVWAHRNFSKTLKIVFFILLTVLWSRFVSVFGFGNKLNERERTRISNSKI